MPDDNQLFSDLLRILATLFWIILGFGFGFAIGLLALIMWVSR